jgi:hypothetical protein
LGLGRVGEIRGVELNRAPGQDHLAVFVGAHLLGAVKKALGVRQHAVGRPNQHLARDEFEHVVNLRWQFCQQIGDSIAGGKEIHGGGYFSAFFLQLARRSAAAKGVTWATVAALAIGAAVAVTGAFLNVPGLIALGGTIVGGVLGNAIPGRAAHHEGLPTSTAGVVQRRRRRRATPAQAFADQTVKSRFGQPPGA